MRIVYYSGPSETTKRFVDKIGMPAIRLPMTGVQPTADEPYILVCPTYGGGAAAMGRTPHFVPQQVKKFLADEKTRAQCLAIIGCGNRNFGEDYGRAAREISRKIGVPIILNVELAGTVSDVDMARRIIMTTFDSIEVEDKENK